jgi:RNA polymerase sigma factor (sigma-70 family)
VSNPESFASFERGLRAQDDAAVQELLSRFTERLIRLAQGQLAIRLQSKEDPQDIVQSTMRTFCIRFADGQFTLGGWDGLWAILAKITTRKCLDRSTRYSAAKRDFRREIALDSAAPGESELELWSREPQPEDALLLAETVEMLLKSLENDRERAILEFALQGYSPPEIAPHVGRTARSVQRVLARVREQLTTASA